MDREFLRQLCDDLRNAGVKRFSGYFNEVGKVTLEFHDAGAPGAIEAHNLDPSGAAPEPATEAPQTEQEKHIANLDMLLRSSGVALPARLKELPKGAD